MTPRICALLLAVLAPLAACASQVDSSYQGDALAKISGSVRNTRTLPLDKGAEVVVVWMNSSGTPDLTGVDSVEVQGSFPAQFALSIYEPPATPLLNDWYGVKVGVALVIAGVPGTDWSDRTQAKAGTLGAEVDHMLIYVPDGVPAGSAASIVLRGTPGPGFHLYGIHKLTDAERMARRDCVDGLDPNAPLEVIYSQCGGSASFDDFVPLSTDLSTPLTIDLVDDPSTIDYPNWT